MPNRTLPDGNPFLGSPFVDFAKLKPLHIAQAVKNQISLIKKIINKISQVSFVCFKDLEPLFYEIEMLFFFWKVANHLHAVANNPELRKVIAITLPKLTQCMTTIKQNHVLYQNLRNLLKDKKGQLLTPFQKELIKNYVRDCYLSGADLNENDKKIFIKTETRLEVLRFIFEQNVLDATNAFALYVADPKKLSGIPHKTMNLLKANAEKDQQKGYKLTLQRPIYEAVLQYADNRSLRKTLYEAYITRASDLGATAFDNTSLIQEHLVLSKRIATLLGFKSYAEVSLTTKMAKTPQKAIRFLRHLAKTSSLSAKTEFENLKTFAKKALGLHTVQAWDIGYVSEKMRQQDCGLSDQEIREYFPTQKVLQGLFSLIEKLYIIDIQKGTASTWHPDVAFYQIFSADKELVGSFYLDLYARKNKLEGAWMNGVVNRFVYQNRLQKPIAYIVCNFTPPINKEESLLKHDDIKTLFHEFGHALHHLLTRVDQIGLSGIDGVQWDAVELPSQLMENFCWEWNVLESLSEQVHTKKSLPYSLYKKMLKNKNFQSGLALARQIEFGLFDLLVHHEFDPKADWMQLLQQIRIKMSPFKKPPNDRSMHSFLHIFAGGYTAGYYSYLWAEVLAADAYGVFENQANWQLGAQSFLENILAVGGTRSMEKSFKAFRGREPDINYLLKSKGLIAQQS